MRISFGMIVVNGEPFIRYNLENIYPHAHEILIVEGAVEKFRHAATPDGHSLDNTVKIIKEFPDPEHKIKLIQHSGFWSEKDEMANAYMEQCTGDYIWQVDVDEFYQPQDIEKVRNFLSDNHEVTRVDIQTINFWHGFKAVMQGASYCYGADQFRRIFKYRPGYRYLTHRPPTVIDEDGNVCGDARVVTAAELAARLDVYMYHYSYVFEEGVKSKADYYARMGWRGCEEGTKWAETAWTKLTNPLRVHLIDFPPSWIIPFQGEHPALIRRMIRDIGYQENPAVEEFLAGKWKRYARIGQYVCDICVKLNRAPMNKYRTAGRLLWKLPFPINSQALQADRTIVKATRKIVSAD